VLKVEVHLSTLVFMPFLVFLQCVCTGMLKAINPTLNVTLL
jgi:hypothetical protein